MNKRGLLKKGYLAGLAKESQLTDQGLFNMAGFDWNATGNLDKTYFANGKASNGRPKYYGDKLINVDFSGSRSQKGFALRNISFTNCIFDDSMWWLAELYKCTFVNCSFRGSRFYSTRLGGKFVSCSFDKIQGLGEYFSFGVGSIYERCSFLDVELNNLGPQYGIQFKKCTFSGALRNGAFTSRKKILKGKRLNPLLRKNKATSFFSCETDQLLLDNFLWKDRASNTEPPAAQPTL